jgi:transcriptional regulator with XRE-family HTH domain
MDYARIGARVAVLRKRRKLTQQKLADICGVHKNSVWNLENGKVDLAQVTSFVALAEALGVAVDELLGHGAVYEPRRRRGAV